MKVAFLIPTTSNKRNWKKIEESYLYNIFLKSLPQTLSNQYIYNIYLGIDSDDKLFNNPVEIEKLEKYILKIKTERKLKFNLIINKYSDIEKGHVTEIWNRLFKVAYNNNEYFYQCGDDIYFPNKGIKWLDLCINQLKLNNNIGIASPLCAPNKKILTQTLVSRKHMDIFGFYFPKQIKNWYCDNWINSVYKPSYIYTYIKYIIENRGMKPRYNYNEKAPDDFSSLVLLGKKYLSNYIKKRNIERKPLLNKGVKKQLLFIN